ncbi:MAG: carboxynorspermidine decarboxylase [Puniceicoccales bacterium]|jgi:carboxynorspermidine decarboxylase|nr:carboxynorspermidine decarboxylase [Puniceicoccales bacterium]
MNVVSVTENLKKAFAGFDFTTLPSPCHLIHRGLLEANCRVLRSVMDATGCKILLALKAFAQFSEFPIIRRHLAGTTASGLHEALLGAEFFGGENHVYSPALTDAEVEALLPVADHISFNRPEQWLRHRARLAGAPRKISCGLRVNPGYAEVETELYNPCAPFSRLGAPRSEVRAADLDGLEGLHFHTMCEQDSDTLARTIPHFEEHFGAFIPQMRWVNFGGGHHITRPGYNLALLRDTLTAFRERWGGGHQIYLEPGEAVVIGTGVLVSTVLEVVHNAMPIAILDTSATAHMPDTLEMPYRPEILGAGLPGEFAHTCRLGSATCLAGDVMGDYSFRAPLKRGDKVVFLDMSHYTMVKNTTFNGVNLPAIAAYDPENARTHIVRRFGYADYKSRLS